MSDVMQIEMEGGGVVLIDRADWRHVQGYTWRLTNPKYPYASAWSEGTQILMHRLLMGAAKGQIVDHRNKRTLDNRRDNLRLCTAAQVQQRRKPNANSRLGLRGVKAERRASGSIRYRAVVVHEGAKHRKWFRCPEAADAWAKQTRLELFGEFAK